MTSGEVTAAKIQVFLIGKRILEHENWFSILDTIYRNPNFSINTRVVVVDGPVSDVMFYEPKDKPLLPLYLKEVIDKNNERTRTIINTFQELHRQIYEKGITPLIPEIKIEKEPKLVGVSLLDGNGKYVDTLYNEESSLLLVLKNKQKHELTFTFPITSLEGEGGIFHTNEISIEASNINTEVKSKYDQGKFHFDFTIHITGNIAERLFAIDTINKDELEKIMEKEFKSQFEDLVKKIQENKIDPIGLGFMRELIIMNNIKR